MSARPRRSTALRPAIPTADLAPLQTAYARAVACVAIRQMAHVYRDTGIPTKAALVTWIAREAREALRPTGPALLAQTAWFAQDVADHATTTPARARQVLTDPCHTIGEEFDAAIDRAAAHVVAVLAASPPAVRAAFWARSPAVASWFTGPGFHLPSARVVAQHHVLVAAIQQRALSAMDSMAAVARWPERSEAQYAMLRAWTDAWALQDAETPRTRPRDDVWLAVAEHALGATTGPSTQYQRQWRKRVLGQLDQAQRAQVIDARDLLARDVQGGDTATPVSYEALGTFSWLADHGPTSPSVVELDQLLARLPDLPNRPPKKAVYTATERRVRSQRTALSDFARSILAHPALSYRAALGLWRRYPTRDGRLWLLGEGGLQAILGPWWHHPAFAEEICQLLATTPPSALLAAGVTLHLEEMAARLVGTITPDTWLHLVAATSVARDSARLSGAEREEADHAVACLLRAGEQFPERPTAEGLVTLLSHPSRVLRQWAQCALATVDAPAPYDASPEGTADRGPGQGARAERVRR